MRTRPAAPSAPAGGRGLVLRAVAIGVLAGFTSGLFGVGGGVVIVPALVMLAGFDQRRAHATSLAAIIVIAAAGVIGYAEAGEVDWAITAAMLVGGLVGAPLGTWALDRLSERTLRLAFAVLLVITAVRLVVGDPVPSDDVAVSGLVPLVGYVGLGFAAGLAAGLMGIGGGIITVPALTIVAHLPLVMAKGTSLAVIVPTAIVGTLRNRGAGHVDVRVALLVGVGGVVSALAASRLSLDLDPTVSSVLFALLLLFTAARMAQQAAAEAR